MALLILLGAQPAEEGAEAEARTLFQHGKAAYKHKSYDEALASFREAYRRVARPSVLYNIARCEEHLGQVADAYADYHRFLEQGRPDEVTRRDVERKLIEFEPRVLGTVQVSSSPAGAAVYVDGGAQSSGRTPLSLKLRAGKHRLRLLADRAPAREIDLEVAAGSNAATDVVLEQLARVFVSADPPEAEIRRLGDATVMRGSYQAELPPGRHRFSIRSPSGVETIRELVAAAGETVHEHVVLTNAPSPAGALMVHASIGAIVFVDGLPVGSTPPSPDRLQVRLAPGPHDLAVEQSGQAAWRGRVQVASGATTAVDVRLGSDRSRGAKIATWTLGGVGAASLVTGGVFGVMALQDSARFDATHSNVDADRLQSRSLTADVLLGVGAAALITAAIVHVEAAGQSTATIGEPMP